MRSNPVNVKHRVFHPRGTGRVVADRVIFVSDGRRSDVGVRCILGVRKFTANGPTQLAAR